MLERIQSQDWQKELNSKVDLKSDANRILTNIDNKVINKQEEGTLPLQTNVASAGLFQFIDSENNSEDDNDAIWDESTEIEQVEFIVEAGSGTTADNMNSLNKE